MLLDGDLRRASYRLNVYFTMTLTARLAAFIKSFLRNYVDFSCTNKLHSLAL